ncbi:MAG: acyl carrier protein [Cryomorphaceae bacterium]|nr:MAG: acyl carrier protein [Cryomorphaceae bacterium]
MEMSEIISTANAFLTEEFEVDEQAIEGSANFHEILDLDSLDYVDLVVIVDEHFGFKMTADDFKKITTFDDFYGFIAKHSPVNK